MINQRTIDKFQQWEGGIVDPSDVGFTLVDDDDATGTSTPPPSTLGLLQLPIDYLMAKVREIKRDTTELRRGQSMMQHESRRQSRHIDRMAQ